MIAGTRIHLEEIPVIASEALNHRLHQRLGTPFALKIVSPQTNWNTINRISTKCRVNTFLLVHKLILSFYITLPTPPGPSLHPSGAPSLINASYSSSSLKR